MEVYKNEGIINMGFDLQQEQLSAVIENYPTLHQKSSVLQFLISSRPVTLPPLPGL